VDGQCDKLVTVVGQKSVSTYLTNTNVLDFCTTLRIYFGQVMMTYKPSARLESALTTNYCKCAEGKRLEEEDVDACDLQRELRSLLD